MKKIYLLAVIVACLYSIKVYCHFAAGKEDDVTTPIARMQENNTRRTDYTIHYAASPEIVQNKSAVPLADNKVTVTNRVHPSEIRKQPVVSESRIKPAILSEARKSDSHKHFHNKKRTVTVVKASLTNTIMAGQAQMADQCLEDVGNVCPAISAGAGNISLAEVGPLLSYLVLQ